MTQQFVRLLNTAGKNHSDHLIETLISHFWNPGAEWLCRCIPWEILANLCLRDRGITMIDENHAFLAVSAADETTLVTTFSLLCKEGRWYIDWQNRANWLRATECWHCFGAAGVRLRFFEEPHPDEVRDLTAWVTLANKWIAGQCDQEPLDNLVVAFDYDAYEYALAGMEREERVNCGGNSRGNLLLMAKARPDVASDKLDTILYKAVTLHEIVHEYTLRNPRWGGCPEYPAINISLLSEGIADHFMYLWLEAQTAAILDETDHRIARRNLEGIRVAAAWQGDLLDLLNNTSFVEFNSMEPTAANPAYHLAGTLIGYLIGRLGLKAFREHWSRWSELDDGATIREELVGLIDSDEFRRSKEQCLSKRSEFYSMGRND